MDEGRTAAAAAAVKLVLSLWNDMRAVSKTGGPELSRDHCQGIGLVRRHRYSFSITFCLESHHATCL